MDRIEKYREGEKVGEGEGQRISSKICGDSKFVFIVNITG